MKSYLVTIGRRPDENGTKFVAMGGSGTSDMILLLNDDEARELVGRAKVVLASGVVDKANEVSGRPFAADELYSIHNVVHLTGRRGLLVHSRFTFFVLEADEINGFLEVMESAISYVSPQ